MSSNRLMYDSCETHRHNQRNEGSLSYVLYPMKYERKSKCRVDLGVVGGNNVSLIKGNMVDLENDLRGQTRPLTQPNQCPSKLYKPQPKSYIKFTDRYGTKRVDTRLKHLPSCDMIQYKPRVQSGGLDLEHSNMNTGVSGFCYDCKKF